MLVAFPWFRRLRRHLNNSKNLSFSFHLLQVFFFVTFFGTIVLGDQNGFESIRFEAFWNFGVLNREIHPKTCHQTNLLIKNRNKMYCFASSSIGRTNIGSSINMNYKRRSVRVFHPSTIKIWSRLLSSRFDTTQQNSKSRTLGIEKTPLGTPSASHLLNGLDLYEVTADDGHPLTLYGIKSSSDLTGSTRRPVLMLHGRTWSSVPVYHLLGGEASDGKFPIEKMRKSRSLMEALFHAGLQPYCMDFRGFGGTPADKTNSVIPNRCVRDVEKVLEFVARKHGANSDSDQENINQTNILKYDGIPHHLPALLGWSQGALIAHLLAQKNPQIISKLILYGSIYDPLVSYPRSPLYSDKNETDAQFHKIENTFNAAIEDFTIEGSIDLEPASEFAEAALLSDPYKANWQYLCQFNNIDPARVHVPTLVVAGDQDPYAPIRVQAELFGNLGRGVDRTWSIIADADHAVHLLDSGRYRFVNIIKSFIENGKKGEK